MTTNILVNAAAGATPSKSGWLKYLNGGTTSGATADTRPADIVTDANGNVYVLCNGDEPYAKPYIVKYNSSGVRQWSRTLANNAISTRNTGGACTLDSSGNLYVWIADYNGVTSVLYKITSAGSIVWRSGRNNNAYRTGRAYTQKLKVDSAGNIYAVGGIGNSSWGIIYKFNSSGTLLFQRSYWRWSAHMFTDIAIVSDGIIVVGGYSNAGAWFPIVVKLNTSLVPQWATYPQGNNNFSSPSRIALESNGNFYVSFVGSSQSSDSQNRIYKFDSSGTILWAVGISGGINNEVAPNSYLSYTYIGGLALDNTENLFVLCDGMFLTKLDKSTGAVVFTNKWKTNPSDSISNPNYRNLATLLSSDTFGNLYLIGSYFDFSYVSNNSVRLTKIGKVPSDGTLTGSNDYVSSDSSIVSTIFTGDPYQYNPPLPLNEVATTTNYTPDATYDLIAWTPTRDITVTL